MLPDDEDEAVDMAWFLLEHGADPSVADDAGVYAIESALARGLIDAAQLMREASGNADEIGLVEER